MSSAAYARFRRGARAVRVQEVGHDRADACVGEVAEDERPDRRADRGVAERDDDVGRRPADPVGELLVEREVLLEVDHRGVPQREENRDQGDGADEVPRGGLAEQRGERRGREVENRTHQQAAEEFERERRVQVLVHVVVDALDERGVDTEVRQAQKRRDREERDTHQPDSLGAEQPREDDEHDDLQHPVEDVHRRHPHPAFHRPLCEVAVVVAGNEPAANRPDDRANLISHRTHLAGRRFGGDPAYSRTVTLGYTSAQEAINY